MSVLIDPPTADPAVALRRLGAPPPQSTAGPRVERREVLPETDDQRPAPLQRLQHILHQQGRIEWRIVQLQWVVMLLVGVGAVLPGAFGSRLSNTASIGLLVLLAAHPIAYYAMAILGYDWLQSRPEARIAIYTA